MKLLICVTLDTSSNERDEAETVEVAQVGLTL